GICHKELGDLEAAISSYRRALEIAPDDLDCRYNLAGCYQSLGDDNQAAKIYESIVAKSPTHLSSLNNLAYLTHKNGENERARELYEQILKLNPAHVSADYMRAALSGETRSQPPGSYIREVFDEFAGHYEAKLTGSLGYDLPSKLLDIYLHLRPRSRPHRLLDLGCGTGLVGEKFGPLSRSITGVDISRKMLDVARAKQVYEKLHFSEISEFLETNPGTIYDLVVCADVLPYIGELGELFKKISLIMASDGHFMFSVEHQTTDAAFPVLQPSGRFAHSPRYVADSATQTGWDIISETSLELRKEREGWIKGCIYVMNLTDFK
ncbi:MAG: methyltransferase domain-containing protein, partial [Desulfocapsaceae bacterium]